MNQKAVNLIGVFNIFAGTFIISFTYGEFNILLPIGLILVAYGGMIIGYEEQK